jgi:hypothetical protein
VEGEASIDVPAADEAAAAVRELRLFIDLYDEAEVEPDSDIAAKLATARRAVAAYEEVESWDLSNRGLTESRVADDHE